jgi:hypothetical protein
MNFNCWKNEIADMPEQQNDGTWVDLETGLTYEHYCNQTKPSAERKAASDDVKENRKIAKKFGAKALTGTTKQKKWAEQIRANVLTSSSLSDEQKTKFLGCANFVEESKFWIENRAVDVSYFTKENISKEYLALRDVKSKHFDTLARTCEVSKKEFARVEIQKQIDENKFTLNI